MNVAQIASWFKEREKTLSLAESCTGGLVSSMIVAEPGVSGFYLGSVVSYSSKVKIDLLGVETSLIDSMGEVSEAVAVAMADGVRRRLSSDWSVAITGIAGPSGGTAEKPVGTVCFGVCGPDVVRSTTQYFEDKQRQKVQTSSAQFALEFLWESLHS